MSEKMFLDRDMEQKIQELNQEHIDSELIAPDVLYIDMGLFKDVRLGCLLSLIKTHQTPEKSYQYILSQLEKYKDSYLQNPVSTFPNLNISEAMFHDHLHNPLVADEIFLKSPMTNFLTSLKSQLAINANHSNVKEKYKKVYVGRHNYVKDFDRVSIIVNTYPLNLSQSLKDTFAKFLVDNFNVDVGFITTRHEDIPMRVLGEVEEFYLDHIQGLMSNEAFHAQLSYPHFKYNAKYFFARPLFDKFVSDFQKEVKIIKGHMDLVCNFNWLGSSVTEPLSSHKDKQKE